MITALMILAALVVFVALVGVFYQMATSPFMWMYHVICGTPGVLVELLGAIFEAIADGLRG